MKPETQRILVALSGGVDSSVAAYLLKEEGYKVEAAYVRTWENEKDLLGDCPGAKDLADAREVADFLKIPFSVVNFIDFYHQEIVRPMIDGYAMGITPNPDILCNRKMKFGALKNYAQENDFNGLATGHYCKKAFDKDGNALLLEGKDKNKDQSYFLAQISQDQLDYSLFPLGDMKKDEVRTLAREIGLPVAEKKDSQGICFLGKVKVPQFLSEFIDDSPGEIITTTGKLVGYHRGLHRYTLGQRKGIGVPSNTDFENFVVTGKNKKKNQLIVAFENPNESTLWASRFRIESVSFFQSKYPTDEVKLLAKARYRDPSTTITYKPLKDRKAEILFQSAQRALTPGQILAIYSEERLIGSGIYSHSELGRSMLSS